MKSPESQKKCTAKVVIKVTVGTKMRGKVILYSLTMSVICALYVFSVGVLGYLGI